jgi:PleD family two-component response regulator
VNRQSDVTFSLGFAALEPDDTADDLIARADRDMYRRRAERKPRAGSASGAG